ncbi:putative NADPH:quinone reductase [Helianthus annuus]|nr:putative NADPH:quinone reductase [Helianthus annuus]
MYNLYNYQHVEIPVPTPGKGEMLIKIEAVSINPVDWKMQNGVARPVFPPKFPYVPRKFRY